MYFTRTLPYIIMTSLAYIIMTSFPSGSCNSLSVSGGITYFASTDPPTNASKLFPSISPISPPQTPRFLQVTQTVCDRVLVPIVTSAGIFGNILNLVVLTRKEMSSSTNTIMTAMTVSNLLFLFLQIPMFFGHDEDIAALETFKMFTRHYTIFQYVMSNICITCTSWLTVAVALERFLSLRKTIYSKLSYTPKRTKLAITGICVVSCVFHLSKFFEYKPNLDLTKPQPLLPTELGLNKIYDTIMHIANITLVVIVPFVSLVIFNMFVVSFLVTHHRRMLANSPERRCHESAGHRASYVNHVTRVVLSVVITFLICNSVSVYIAFSIAVKGRQHISSQPVFVALKYVNIFLLIVNGSVSFTLYSCLSFKFRKVFVSVFCQRFKDTFKSKAAPVSGI